MSAEVCELLLQLTSVDRRAAVWCVCRCVRTVLHLVPDGEERPRRAIETAEAWIRGEATKAQCRAAASASYDAYNAFVRVPTPDYAYLAALAASAVGHLANHTHDSRVYTAVNHASYAAASACCHPHTLNAEGGPEGTDAAALEEAADRHYDHLLALVSTTSWALTIPTPKQLSRARDAVQVAWDAVANSHTEHTIPELLEAHARAKRLGLDWTDPVQRAIAERALDEDRIRTLLTSQEPP